MGVPGTIRSSQEFTMPGSHSLVVITAQDLAYYDSVLVESDCDCACPTDSFVLTSTAPHAESTRYAMPALHTNAFADNFTLAFNPLSNAGPIILNQSALALLRSFEQPQTLAA